MKLVSSVLVFSRQSLFCTAICAVAVMLISVSSQAQNLFVADSGSGNIYEYTPGGAQSTFASGLSNPLGLAFNSAGDLFEVDNNSGNIYEYTPGGMRSTFASGWNTASGLAFNSAGNLFATDYSSGNIYEFTPGGVQGTFASGLSSPYDLAFDSTGNLFVSDSDSGNIYKFTPGGARTTFASGLSNPIGLAFNSAGDLFVADQYSGNIYAFTPGGAQSTLASGLAPIGVAIQPVPEPSALALLAVGATALLVRCRFRLVAFRFRSFYFAADGLWKTLNFHRESVPREAHLGSALSSLRMTKSKDSGGHTC